MIETMKAGALYRAARNRARIYRVTAISGRKVTAELVSVDGIPAPAAEPVELSLGRARASFVPVNDLAADADTERQAEIMRGIGRKRRGVLALKDHQNRVRARGGP